MSLSASEKVFAANWRLNAVPASASWSAIAFATVGALLAAATRSNVSLTVPPAPSLAVTFTVTVPASAACGVPEKVREEAVKVSHDGSAVSSSLVAV